MCKLQHQIFMHRMSWQVLKCIDKKTHRVCRPRSIRGCVSLSWCMFGFRLAYREGEKSFSSCIRARGLRRRPTQIHTCVQRGGLAVERERERSIVEPPRVVSRGKPYRASLVAGNQPGNKKNLLPTYPIQIGYKRTQFGSSFNSQVNLHSDKFLINEMFHSKNPRHSAAVIFYEKL